MNLETLHSKEAVLLVDRRPELWPHCLFVTISPNPKLKHTLYKRNNGKRISVKVPYGKLPQRCQFEYCLRIVRSSYIYSHDTKLFGTWELNKDGNVHLHMILCDTHLQNKSQLQMFQRDVLNSELVFQNLAKGMIDYMNSIVFVNDSVEKRFDYLIKDIDMNLQIMPYFYHNCPVSAQIKDLAIDLVL